MNGVSLEHRKPKEIPSLLVRLASCDAFPSPAHIFTLFFVVVVRFRPLETKVGLIYVATNLQADVP